MDGYQCFYAFLAKGSSFYWAIIQYFDVWQRNILFYFLSFYKREEMEDSKLRYPEQSSLVSPI